MSEPEPLNTCDECGSTFYYAPSLHECAHKGRRLAGSEHAGESWLDECMRRQREPTNPRRIPRPSES